jgi:hypothetical protein
MDACVNPIQKGTVSLQQRAQLIVHLVNEFHREITASGTRLVGDHHYPETGLIQPLYRPSGAWEQHQAIHVVNVPHLLIDGTVSI